jgi:hypothetical protein
MIGRQAATAREHSFGLMVHGCDGDWGLIAVHNPHVYRCLLVSVWTAFWCQG